MQTNLWSVPVEEQTAKTDCNIRFQGQYFDEESGLHYNFHRYYDPQTGRYLSNDPIGLNGGMNTYGYIHNPLTWVDPFGLNGYEPTGGWTKPKGWRLPKNGTWTGTPGHSDFMPSNPSSLGLRNGDKIPFRNGYPDFSGQSQGSINVPGMTGDHSVDMPLIYQQMSQNNPTQFPNPTAARTWLSQQGLTPHHAGGTNIQYVPTVLHGNV